VSYRVCGLDPCTPFRPGPKSKKPAKLPVWVWHRIEVDKEDYWVEVAYPPPGRIDLLVAERPHTHGPAGAEACITMGVWAGWLAAQVGAARTLCMPATVWKDILFPSFGKAPKAIYCANIVQMLNLKGLNPKVDADQDIIDAHGLCAVAAKLVTEGSVDAYAKKWELKL
jgi:hypothetical protein